MIKDPWTDSDPQPGDFDAEIESMDPREVQAHEGNPDAKVKVLVGVSSDNARRLATLAAERGQGIDEVVADLVRDA